MKKPSILTSALLLISFLSISQAAFAQNDTMDDVHLFLNFFRDAPIAARPYGEANLTFLDYENGSQITIGPQIGIPLTPELEFGAALSYVSLNPEGDADGASGLSDIDLYGRYNFFVDRTKISAGSYISLPTRSDDLGEGRTNLGIFGAVRHPLSAKAVLTANLGLDFLETADDDRETQINLGAGVIYAATDQVSLVGELQIQSETEFSNLLAGVDYLLQGNGRLRGALLIGLDDGAPDLGLSGSYLISF